MVKLLLEHGGDVRLNDNEFRSVIHWATGNLFDCRKKKTNRFLACGHSHLFDIFRRYDAPFHTADVHGAFPIHYASKFEPQRSSTVLKQILESDAPIDSLDDQKRTALIWAASSGEKSIEFSSCKREFSSCFKGADEELRILFENGANANHGDKENLTGSTKRK